MDYQTIVVALAIVGALAFTGRKAWKMLSPSSRGAGCGCGTEPSGCGGCPLVKDRPHE